MFGGCFSSREASCRVQDSCPFWTQQKSLPFTQMKEANCSTVSLLCLLSRPEGSSLLASGDNGVQFPDF